MNQLQPRADDYKFIVAPTITGGLFAEEFRTRFYSEYHLNDVPEPDLGLILNKHELKDIPDARKKILYYFQRSVMTSYGENILESSGASDELLHDEDPDVVSMYRVYKEFKSNYPSVEVYSMLPIDMNGTFGFVIYPNDMYSS